MGAASDIVVPKAYSWGDIEKRNFKTLNFEGEWFDHIGKPELSGSWITWGHSGNGKTDYVVKGAKYLSNFTRVHYNTLEEGMRQSFKIALARNNIKGIAKGKFGFHKENYDALVRRLEQKRSAKFIVIDSVQYFFRGMTIKHYFELLDHFPEKLFHFVSHAQGTQPKGKLADDIRYNSDAKFFVKDFVAEVQTSRFGGKKPFTIWEEGARERQLKLIKEGK